MRYERVQILRLLAATMVAAFHSYGTGMNYLGETARLDVLSHGNFGVNLFFVISGFIICYTAQTRESDWRTFLSRRIARIVPLYWFCTIVMMALLVALPSLFRNQNPDLLSGLLRSLTFTSLLSGKPPLVYVGWSLEYEMFFYGLAAASLALLPRPWTAITALLSVLTIIGALAWPVNDKLLFFHPIVVEFALGVVIAQTVLRRAVPIASIAAVGAALAVLLWKDGVTQMVFVSMLATAIVSATIWIDLRSPLRSRVSEWLVMGGNASYAIYLIQVFTVSTVCKLALILFGAVPLELLIVVATAATVAAGVILYWVVEKPLNTAALRLLGSPRAAEHAVKKYSVPK